MRSGAPRALLAAALALTTSAALHAQKPIAPGLDVIKEADLKRDMFAMAGDAMRGREAGTLDEMRATGWVAERAREAGLLPAGEDDTFFQWWPMRRNRLSENSEISVGGKTLRMWKDVVVMSNQTQSVDLPIVFVSDTTALRFDGCERQSGGDGRCTGADTAARSIHNSWKLSSDAVAGNASTLGGDCARRRCSSCVDLRRIANHEYGVRRDGRSHVTRHVRH